MEIDMGKFFEEHRREVFASLGLIAITLLVVTILYFSGGGFESAFVPQEFTDARRRAASTAQNIVLLTAAAAENLAKISEADRRGDYGEGVRLAAEERERTEEIRDAANDLSEDLRDMASGVSEVSPARAREVGFEAVAVGVSLVERLVAYTDATDELLLVIQSRLQSNGREDGLAEIEELTNRVNAEVAEVNRLNEEYRALMARFDELTGEGR